VLLLLPLLPAQIGYSMMMMMMMTAVHHVNGAPQRSNRKTQ
jgi:hypothetical protein